MSNLTPVNSSNVLAVGVDASDLIVEFRSGGVYRYPGKADLYPAAISAESVGRFVNQNVVKVSSDYIRIN